MYLPQKRSIHMEITVNSLVKKFGEKIAVDIPQLNIGNGEIIGLVGNNGAGKTTLFLLMLDLLKASAGSVGFKTREGLSIHPTESEEWKDYTGAYIHEGFLIGFLTPEEYFHFIARVNGISDDEMRKRLELLAPLMMGEILEQNKLIREFSAGNKQKIGIIGAMLNTPDLLILDEPFNFLDPSGQNVLKKVLTDYHNTTNATILISSHNLQYTVDISTRIILLEHGNVIKDLPNNEGSAAQELNDYFSV